MASILKNQVTDICTKTTKTAKRKNSKASDNIKITQENDLAIVDILICSLKDSFSSCELDLKTASAILNQLVTTRKNILSYNIVDANSETNWIKTMQIRDLHGKSI